MKKQPTPDVTAATCPKCGCGHLLPEPTAKAAYFRRCRNCHRRVDIRPPKNKATDDVAN
jgi:uncharacterized protein (DUF983 family)